MLKLLWIVILTTNFLMQSIEVEEATVLEEPVQQEVVVEQLNVAEVEGHDAETLIDLGRFKVTAYCACSKCCGPNAKGITYSGALPSHNHTIAVDPKVIPLGSTVIVGGNRYRAEDIGGAIKGNRIDIYFSTHEEALKFGIQRLEVKLVEVDR